VHGLPVDRVPVAQLATRLGIKTAALYDRLNTLEKLGIDRIREGRHVYFPAQHLPLLDALDQHLKAKRTIAEFLAQHRAEVTAPPPERHDALPQVQRDLAVVEGQRPGLLGLQHQLQTLFPSFWAAGEATLARLAAPFIANQDRMVGQLTQLNTHVEQLDATVAAMQTVSPAVAHLRDTVLPQFEHLKAALAIFESCAQTGALLLTAQLALLVRLNPKTISKQQTFQRQGDRFTKVGKEGRESVWRVTKLPSLPVCEPSGQNTLQAQAATSPQPQPGFGESPSRSSWSG